MALLTTTLVILALTTASARPHGLRQHYDADIADSSWEQGWLDRSRGSSQSTSNENSSSESHDSSESSESSEESSEEVIINDQTTAVMTTDATSTITKEGSGFSPEPDTISTDDPGVTVTVPTDTTTTAFVVTSPGNVTHSVTEEIPTIFPITENRGDN